MFLETIRSEGLAHHSYLVGDKGRAAVIDPRRDCEVYIDRAHHYGAMISHIFETHRNEDYVIGSRELSEKTGASIYHGKHLDFKYGSGVSEGEVFEWGDIRLSILETPGHTYESLSIVLADKGFGNNAVAIFTGDALFIGDVGRTDFFPDRAEEVAGLLYDSIFEKILPLGDHVIVLPAHGAGSVCGAGMASREFSTLGYERLNNPALKQDTKDAFIQYKINEHHYKPPYFRQMERYNLEGPPLLKEFPNPVPSSANQFAQAMDAGMIAIDLRSPEAFAGAFIPGSMAIPLNMIPAFAGWFLPYDKPIGLVGENRKEIETAVRYLVRLGYDTIYWYLEGGLHEWEISGRTYDSITTVHVDLVKSRLDMKNDFMLLDVRRKDEFQNGHLPNATHIYLGELPDRLDSIPGYKTVTTFCGSGRRAIIAASILKMKGFKHVEDCLGSMSACTVAGCPIVTDH